LERSKGASGERLTNGRHEPHGLVNPPVGWRRKQEGKCDDLRIPIAKGEEDDTSDGRERGRRKEV